MEGEYSRKILLEEGLMPADRWLSLKYGKHSSGRNEERKTGSLDVLPRRLKCGKNNIWSLTYEEGKIKKIIVRLDYSPNKWLFLVIVDDYFVKTIWWRDKKQAYGKNMGKRVRLQTVEGVVGREKNTITREVYRILV